MPVLSRAGIDHPLKEQDMKVVIFAFAHHDNILSYTDPLVKYTDLDVTVILIGHGDKLFSDSFETDLRNVKYGLTTENVRDRILPAELRNYFEPGLKIWFLRLASRKMTLRNLILSFRILTDLAKKTRNEFDVYHFNGVGIYSLFLSHVLKSRNKILTIHDYIPHSGEGNKLIMWSNKQLVRNFDHFIQHYDHLAEEMAGYFKLSRSQVHTVRSGTFDFIHQFPFKPSPYMDYILFFGRISPYKGLRYLVEAFVEYCKKHDKLDLVIAGGGDASDCQAMIDGEPRIHFLNRVVPNEELSGLIKDCKCIVLPYKDVTHSGVVLHAYTFGKPVIASNLGGLKEVIIPGLTGQLLSDLNKETIVESIESLPEDPLEEARMHDNIMELTKKGILSWPAIAQEYQKVYSLVYQH